MPERTVGLNGVELRVTEQGAGPPVVLAHGFPELAYSWRHQLPALAEAGYHALAPDQRGYGGSSSPQRVEDYDILHLTGDLIALLDDLDAEQGVFVGHDWGALVVWQLALLHPERVAGVCGMSVPFLPRAPAPPIGIMRARFADAFNYIVYFQEPGVADADLGADPATTMRRLLAGLRAGAAERTVIDMLSTNDERGFVERLPEPEGLPDWLSREELDHYVTEFGRTGFTGGLNWYRNFDRNWELTPQLANARVEVPSLFVGGGLDPVLATTPVSIQDEWLTDHRGSIIVEDAGHWVQQERPAEVNAALLDFLGSLTFRERT